MREHFDWAVERRFEPFRALGDGADFAGGLSEKSYNLGSFGIIGGTYADSCVFGQHNLPAGVFPDSDTSYPSGFGGGDCEF